MGLRDWVSEKVGVETIRPSPSMLLQWGSETGSRRRDQGATEYVHTHGVPSMGLRDWVSEKGAAPHEAPGREAGLQWGSETGSRRRAVGR